MIKNKKTSIILFATLYGQLFCPSTGAENKRPLEESLVNESSTALKIARLEQPENDSKPFGGAPLEERYLELLEMCGPETKQKTEERRLLNEKIGTPVNIGDITIKLEYSIENPKLKRGYVGSLRIRFIDNNNKNYLGTLTLRAKKEQIEQLPLADKDKLVSSLRAFPVGTVFFGPSHNSLIHIYYRLTDDLTLSDDGKFQRTNVARAETFFQQLLLDNGSLKSTFIEDFANFGRFLKTVEQVDLTPEDRLSERFVVINPTHTRSTIFKSFNPEEFYGFVYQLNKAENKSQE